MSSPTLLAQLDAILIEVQKLRATLQTRHAVPKRIDYVAQLSGALGPAAPDEREFFREDYLDWERFAA